jgi:hypothetical protein
LTVEFSGASAEGLGLEVLEFSNIFPQTVIPQRVSSENLAALYFILVSHVDHLRVDSANVEHGVE